jgi:hypothetical protein
VQCPANGMQLNADQTGEALAGELRPGNADANNAADQIAVAKQAVAQIPAVHIETIEIVLRVDSAGASHDLLDWCREGQIEFSVRHDLTETVRSAILQIPDGDWVCSLDQDGHARPNRQVSEITEHLDLSSWPQGTRVIIRRERAHPGAQLSFTDHDGHRFQPSSPTRQAQSPSVSVITAGALASRTTSANDKDTGLRNLPFRDFAQNQVWLQIIRLAHDLIVWTPTTPARGRARQSRTQRLRYRLLHVAGRLAFHARTATLHLPAAGPWAGQLAAAFARLAALPAPA